MNAPLTRFVPDLPGMSGIDGHRVLSVLAYNLRGMIFRCSQDDDWTLHFVSAGCLELTGYSSIELIERRITTLEQMTEPEDRQRARPTISAKPSSTEKAIGSNTGSGARITRCAGYRNEARS